MKEYKRLTERVGKGVAIKETSTNDNKSIWNGIERLAELEDKIENGTFIELPCKVGDTVYVINGKDELEEAVVLNYAVNKLGYNFDVSSKDTNEEYYLFDFDFNKDWFLTKAEAEKKLKEQQNER